MKKWRAHIAPNPDGVSRHVRRLDLEYVRLSDLERFEEHLCALTQVKTLCVLDCDYAFRYASMEWFLPMRSSLTDLVLTGPSATLYSITSLLAVLPLLNRLVIYGFVDPGDADETSPPALSRTQISEGTNRLTLGSGGHPEGALDWTPSSARFVKLTIDMKCVVRHPDLMNQWLASSCATLTDLLTRWRPNSMSRTK